MRALGDMVTEHAHIRSQIEIEMAEQSAQSVNELKLLLSKEAAELDDMAGKWLELAEEAILEEAVAQVANLLMSFF